MRSGYFDLTTADVLRGAGVGGFSQSSRAVDYVSSVTAAAHYLTFNTAAVGPSGGPGGRWFGFPLRCLSTVLDMWYNVLQKGGEYIVKKF